MEIVLIIGLVIVLVLGIIEVVRLYFWNGGGPDGFA